MNKPANTKKNLIEFPIRSVMLGSSWSSYTCRTSRSNEPSAESHTSQTKTSIIISSSKITCKKEEERLISSSTIIAPAIPSTSRPNSPAVCRSSGQGSRERLKVAVINIIIIIIDLRRVMLFLAMRASGKTVCKSQMELVRTGDDIRRI